MGKKPKHPNSSNDPNPLREKAEALLNDSSSTATPARSADELLHDLHVQQIELEMQNETLRESQLALEKSRDCYTDLYEFAPVGYLTLTHEAMISEINLTGAALLGVERKKLIRRRFSTLVFPADRDRWHQIFIHALRLGERQSCDLVLQRGDGSCFYAHLEGLHPVEESSGHMLRFTFSDITKLKEADERYRSVFEEATDGIVIADVGTGEIVDCNHALANIVNRSKFELVGKPLSILFPPETVEPFFNIIGGLDTNLYGTAIETQFFTKGGKLREVEVKLSTMTMNGRGVEFGIIRDVTDRHHARERENRLRNILDNTLDMIFILSPDTLNFVYTNNGASKSIGYSREAMFQMSPMDIMPISEAECRAFIAPLVNGSKGKRRFETELTRCDEKKIHVEAQLQFVRGDGDNGLFVAVVRDNTRRKFAENELRRQKNLLWQVVDMDPNVIFVKDGTGKFLLANQVLADFYGTSIQRLIGKKDSDFNPNRQEVESFLASDLDVIKNKREFISTESMMKDGKQYWYHTVKRPLLQADGSANVLGIAVDITAMKLSKIELDQSYKELQRLSLYLENVRAEERALIARNLHDEMGATLAALKMRVAWLASKLPVGMTQLSEEVGHISELVSGGINTMRQVVSELRPNLLDDVGLIAAVKDYAKRFQRDTEIECSIVFPEEDFKINTDQAVTVFRIIQESLNNVAKHSQASKVNIFFVVDGESLFLLIKDYGIGFDTSRKAQSFGLLGIKERARMIGGSATIESVPGQGTQVSVNIPIHPPENQ